MRAILVHVLVNDIPSVRSAIDSTGITIDESYGDRGIQAVGDAAFIKCVATREQEDWLWQCPGVVEVERVEQLRLHRD